MDFKSNIAFGFPPHSQTPSKSASKNTQQQQQQPSISITALPRQPNSAGAGNLNAVALQLAAAQSKAAATMTGLNAANAAAAAAAAAANIKPGQAVSPGQKSFVICEICDSYIKDLDQLRNHMQWMHKVKVCVCVAKSIINIRLRALNSCECSGLMLKRKPPY